jgi:hypothetical protein
MMPLRHRRGRITDAHGGRRVDVVARAARHGAWLELAIVALVYVGYDAVRGLIGSDERRATLNGDRILRLEHLLAVSVEHPLNRALQHDVVLAVPACYFYASAHFLVTPAILIWMFHAHRDRYGQVRTVLALVTVLALLGFWLLPTAPPRLLPGAGFHDTLAAYSNWGWWSASDSAPKPLASLANQFAAFPSLHIAWATWAGVTLWRHAARGSLRVFGLIYPAMTALVVLATANHYLLDAVAGLLLWFVVDRSVRIAARSPARCLASSSRGGERR